MPGERPLRARVIDELQWDPAVDATRIKVATSEGLVILGGSVRTYAEKCRAEEIVKQIRGVARVSNELEVRVTIGDYRTDATLQRVVAEVLEASAEFAEERPRVSVSSGWITLDGRVAWAFQKRLAEETIRGIAGVRGITNRICVVPRQKAAENLGGMLTEALRRRAIDVDRVAITTDDGRVVLRGVVQSLAEHDELLDLAWRAAGVHTVEDHIEVG